MLKVFKTPCENCLFSDDKIVSNARKKELLSNCKKEQTHFICHKSTIKGEDTVCSGFYKKMGHVSQLIRIMQRIGGIELIGHDIEKIQ